VRAKLRHRGGGERGPGRAFAPNPPDPGEGGLDGVGDRLLLGKHAGLEDRGELLEATPATLLARLPRAAEEEGRRGGEALGGPEHPVIEEALALGGPG